VEGSGWGGELGRIAAGDLRRAAKVVTLEGRELLDSRTRKALRGVEGRVAQVGDVEAAATLLDPIATGAGPGQQRAARRLVRAVYRLDRRLDRAIAKQALTHEVDETQRRFERALVVRRGERVGPLLAHTLSQLPARPPLT
jgi:hypothetical protein